MKTTLAAFCALCFVASSAHTIRRENPSLEAPIDAESKAVGAEAILVGQALRYVARELAQDETLNKELEEYFLGKVFGTIKGAVKKVAEVAGDVAKGVAKVAVSPIKAAVEVIKEHASFSAQDNITDKATKILNTILEKSVASYSSQDSQKAEDFVKQVCLRIDAVGQRLIEQGEEVLGLYDVNF
uniref:Putative secreted protein n=1 Tax=Amblyomma cajennense TaxID=34607 RepID=A0A023FTW7_AMBCJ